MLITLFIMGIIGLCAGVFASVLNYDTNKDLKEIRKDIDDTRHWIRDEYMKGIKKRDKGIEKGIKEDKK